MDGIDLANELDNLNVVDENDLVLGYSKAGKKFGFVPVSFVTNGGYACRRWNMNNSSPTGEAVGYLEYLRNLPSLLGLGCYLVDKNHGRRKLDPTNHYKFATGETAKLDGTMGDYMWGWSTKWYYAWWVEGSYYYEAASLKPIPGRYNYVIPVASTSALGVSIVDRENNELVSVVNESARYRGGDNDAAKDSTYKTFLGRAATCLSAETFGSYARKKGEGWEGYWYAHSGIIGALFRIIFGTRNVQSAYNANKDSNGLFQGGLGYGVVGSGHWWSSADGYNFYPFLPTSAGVELADNCGVSNYAVKGADGSTVCTVPIPSFFGLKNFFGYLTRYGRGELISKKADGSGDMYIVPRLHSTYSMSSLTGLTKAASFPKSVFGDSFDYIKQLSMQNLCHTPVLTGGTSSTYYADCFYIPTRGPILCVPSRGGSTGLFLEAGLETLFVSNGVSESSAAGVSPLCEADEDWDTTPFLAV